MSGDDNIIRKHSIVIAGHQTSITLEHIFWNQLKRIARKRNISLSTLICEIDAKRDSNLSSAIRVYVVKILLEEKQTLPTL